MAEPGCRGEMCEFTGSRVRSEATPGRCTSTGGYLAIAEINEIIGSAGSQTFHDQRSNSDVLLHNGENTFLSNVIHLLISGHRRLCKLYDSDY